MTKRDFFRILIKVFGLYGLILVLFGFMPSQIASAVLNLDYSGWIFVILSALFVIFLFFFLIKKPDLLINLLKLDKGFDDDQLQLGSMTTKNILSLSAFIIGGLLLIEKVPNFLSQTYFAFQLNINGDSLDVKEKINLVMNLFNIILGVYLVFNFKSVSAFFEERSDTKAEEKKTD